MPYQSRPITDGMAALKPLAPLLILIYACLFLPREATITIAGLNVTAYRIVIAIFIIPAIARYVRGSARFLPADALVWLGTFWILVAFVNHFDPLEGLIRGASVVLDSLGAYLIARTSIRSYDDLRRLLIAVAPGFCFVGAIMAIESVTHTVIYRQIFATILGPAQTFSEGEAIGDMRLGGATRMGLMRSYASFSHPILAGVTMVSLLPLYYMSGIRSWPLWMGLGAAACGIFSVSSAVFLMLMSLAGMIAIDKVKPYVRLINWPLVCAGALFVLISFHLASESGIVKLIVRNTFSPHNGYVRIMQWDAAMEALRNSPWVGIAYQRPPLPAWLPPSIDSHFLVLGLRTGWITTLSIYAAAIGTIAYLGLNVHRFPASERNLIVGVNFSMTLWLLASFTVMFFAETNIFFMIALGLTVALAQAPRYRMVSNEQLR